MSNCSFSKKPFDFGFINVEISAKIIILIQFGKSSKLGEVSMKILCFQNKPDIYQLKGAKSVPFQLECEIKQTLRDYILIPNRLGRFCKI